MNAKYLVVTLCVASAGLAGPARAQSSPHRPAAATKKVVAKPAKDADSTAPANSAAPAAKVASAQRLPATPAAMTQPGYYPGPEYPQTGEGEYLDGTCCDDGCCTDPGLLNLNSWVCVPTLATWGSVEYLMWWRKGEFLPPLASTGPVGPGLAGDVLFGNERVDFGPRPGGRIAFGLWLDDARWCGVGARGWALSDGNVNFEQTVAAGAGAPPLFRPFIEADSGNPNAININANNLGGSLDIQTQSEVYGGDVLVRNGLQMAGVGRLDFVWGYQFSRFNEDLRIESSTTVAPPPALVVFDEFDANNEFHGGVLGMQAEMDRGPFTVGFLGKVGLGNMHQTMTIDGGGNPDPLRGLLAQTPNIGLHSRDEFAVVPEVNVNLGFRATENVDLMIGYSMIYWSDVVRPGSSLDLRTDVLAPINNQPPFRFNNTDFWVMGFNAGCQVRF